MNTLQTPKLDSDPSFPTSSTTVIAPPIGNSGPSLRAAAEKMDLAAVMDLWQTATDRLQRTHESLRDEVRRLSDELEIKNRELARKNRLADLGQMAAHVAHEVRNSLAPVTLYLSLLRRRIREDAGACEVLGKIESSFQALEATVTDLLHFTADRDPQRRSLAVPRLIGELCESLAPQFASHGVRVSIVAPDSLSVDGDEGMLRRALLNLTLNALDVMPRGGELVISATGNGQGCEIEVADSGPGISDDVRRRLFEPFFTTKSEGTGLGLAIVQRIAEAHDGEVLARNCPEGGAAFTLRLPQQKAEQMRSERRPAA